MPTIAPNKHQQRRKPQLQPVLAEQQAVIPITNKLTLKRKNNPIIILQMELVMVM
ncbi:MAG: hypothetical protein HY802_05270 [Methanobacterium sp.]|nr:hypothetical protein [Methanobacterium sp.]